MGAVVGASARNFVSDYAARVFSSSFPFGILIINVTGSLVVGFFLVWTSERVLIDVRVAVAHSDRLLRFLHHVFKLCI